VKLCPTCGQSVAEEINTCPSCGSGVGEGRRSIDDYRIIEVLREGYSSLLCHAVHEQTNEQVMIRLFTPDSGVDEELAARLDDELQQLKDLSHPGLVRHDAIRRSNDGLWYRISEWIDSESWGSLLASGQLRDMGLILDLFHQMASILAVLHEHGHFIPHLILSDIIPAKAEDDKLKIKVDFKLSRFIDPWLDRRSPMLRKLLSSHPDIVNERPLDFKSDIWSLGKIFVELLSADLESTDYVSKIEDLEVPKQLQVLLRVMLSEDPDLRPSSMREIAASIEQIENDLRQPVSSPPREVSRPAPGPIERSHKRRWIFAAMVIALLLAGVFIWFGEKSRWGDVDSRLESYANRYAPSVAFLLVEYWLEADGRRVYHDVAEGTAFLVDKEGYMLTSRHVACPWLEDSHFDAMVRHLRLREASLDFGYRSFLWFDGQRAFNRAGGMIEGPDLSDFYFVENAFSNKTPPHVKIAGVAKPPVRFRQLLTSPLKDDFAVIRIEKVPPGLVPIPLDLDMDPRKLAKLTRMIALGFPLGSRTQADTVNVSAVRGNIRRTFENMFQIDASLHGGNSGGPVIDARGKVIGIVSAVALDFSQGLVPMVTPVWDIGLILPIGDAVQLLEDLKGGEAKWSGVPDFSQEKTVAKIRETAARGRWAEAMVLADETLSKGLQPALVSAAGMLHFCNEDYPGSRLRFSQALSMDGEDNQARLMLMLIDWLSGTSDADAAGKELLQADWRSSAEFQGYVARILAGQVTVESALKGWDTMTEKSWVFYASGLLASREGDKTEAERLFQEAVLAGDPDSWELILSQVALQKVRKERRNTFRTDEQWTVHNTQVKHFEKALSEALETKKKRRQELAPLWAKLADETSALEDRKPILEKLLEQDPENRRILAALVFCAASLEAWPDALAHLRNVLKEEGRPNALRMSLGLLEAGILHYQGNDAEAEQKLTDLSLRLRDPWFLLIGEYLQGRQTEDFLKKGGDDRPEDILTASTAMGFWAEGSKEKSKALRFYREALGSFLTDWLEYGFARERVKRLKKAGE
jgi:S1-C subfamily serine protease